MELLLAAHSSGERVQQLETWIDLENKSMKQFPNGVADFEQQTSLWWMTKIIKITMNIKQL